MITLINNINEHIEALNEIRNIIYGHNISKIQVIFYSENDDHQECHYIESIIIDDGDNIWDDDDGDILPEFLGKPDTKKLDTAIGVLMYDTDTISQEMVFTKAEFNKLILQKL